MRLIRLFCGLFALLTVISVGGLQLVRVPSDQPDHWLIFLGGKEVMSDIYLASPDGSYFKNLTHTPHLREIILAISANQEWLLIYQHEVSYYDPYTIYLMRPNGNEKKILFEGLAYDQSYDSFDWSPDNRWLVYTSHISEDSSDVMHLINPTTGEQKQLAKTQPCQVRTSKDLLSLSQVEWSPSSDWIYFRVLFCDLSGAIYRIHPDGTSLELVVNDDSGWKWWSADRKWLIFYRENATETGLYRSRPDGSQLERLVDRSYQIIAIDDTDTIYLASDNTIYRMRLDGTEFTKLIDHADSPQIVKQWLYFQKQQTNGIEIYAMNLQTMKTHQITQNKAYSSLFTVSPDGQWVYFRIYNTTSLSGSFYKIRIDGSNQQKLSWDTTLEEMGGFQWFQGFDLPWHPLPLGIGGFITVLIIFGVRKAHSKSS